ncbi:FAD-binding oxidoreductase [Arthrobacter sp. zg-Y859]|uniref:FAD-binding oxidoreductase n=1 Tax=Arthrobacter jinronghuae TaxID=2964609 RepID=A0ABT1NUP7_9MICC|nr:FAD-binding oxidoreductase [Arthrobacter jinronghuae]MCQ1951458.1 FAD-binding oxidoreductase [Arthrobacter jinronghuae]UWX78902.1 FAD-binding oxidoreductase [Arthrobacter jinronghuae]
MTSSPSRVAVIGGGILGVSTAVHLLRGGASVILVTEADLASGASGRSLSWLNSAGQRTNPYHKIRVAGIDRYRTLFASDPTREWLHFDGGLHWAGDGDAETTKARHAYEKAHGYDSKLVNAHTVGEYTTGINSGSVPTTAIFNPGEGWVSLPHLIDFLMEEFKNRGGQLITHAGKTSVQVADGRAIGVTTSHGEHYPADAVLVACGQQTPAVVKELGVDIPDASPVSMLVITEPVTQKVRPVMNTPRVALRPNPGNTLALDHDWYEESITENVDGTYTIAEAIVQQLVDEAAALLEGKPALKPASWKLGRKPIPGDGEPVFGELQEVPGCFVAFSHSGATIGLIAGELLAEEILTDQKHPMLATFRPERFQ